MLKYDVCIIGAGPCGLTCALELCKYFKVSIIELGRDLDKRICKLDRGEKCTNCNPCNVISGFGGCQFTEGTKACYYPAGSNLLKFGTVSQIKYYYNYVDGLLNKFGKENNKRLSSKINPISNTEDLKVKYYNAVKIEENTMKNIGKNIYEYLNDKVDFYLNERVLNIEENDDYIITTNKNKFICRNVIIATGRYGSKFLRNVADELNLDYSNDKIVGELGVRVEMPKEVFESINNHYNDLKLINEIDEFNEVRTFCQNYAGRIRKCFFDKRFSLDGTITGNTNSVNIAIHHRMKNNINPDDFNKLIRNINRDGKPIAQDMKSFMKSTIPVKINDKYSTFKDYKLANINDYIPQKSINYIKDMIIKIDKILPGFLDDDNIVYAPSFELGIVKYKLTENFMTNLNGLYIGGDACGEFRGLLQAMISAKIISENIIKKYNN